MQLREIKSFLNAFAKKVVDEAKANLKSQKKNVSGRLSDSLDYDLSLDGLKFILTFLMEDYGEFQDRGVSGRKRKYDTPYSYKDKMPPPKSLDQWVVRKGIKGVRDAKGRFIKRKSLRYLIARSIMNNGIKPSLFFTKPFDRYMKDLPDDITKTFANQIQIEIANYGNKN